MERAIDETNRRRDKQIAYNKANGIDPQPLRKKIADILDSLQREDADTDRPRGRRVQQSRGKAPVPGFAARQAGQHAKTIAGEMPRAQMESLIESLTEQMHQAARRSAVRGGRPAARRDQGAQAGAARHAGGRS